MMYDLDVEIHGVTKKGRINVIDNGEIELLLVVMPSGRLVDLTILLACPDIYNSIEHDWLDYVANLEV